MKNDLIHRLKLVHATLTPTDDREIDVTSPEYPSLDSLTQYLVSNKLLSSKDKEVSIPLLARSVLVLVLIFSAFSDILFTFPPPQ